MPIVVVAFDVVAGVAVGVTVDVEGAEKSRDLRSAMGVPLVAVEAREEGEEEEAGVLTVVVTVVDVC